MATQKNKAHKPGRRAGLSAREKHRQAKGEQKRNVKQVPKAGLNKADRDNAARQQRDKQREDILAQRRQLGPPRVVTLVPLSRDVNIQSVWNKCLLACTDQPLAMPSDNTADETMTDKVEYPVVPTLSELPGRHQAYWLPPTNDPSDPLSLVEVARQAEIVLLVFPETGEIDKIGELALSVLREFGLPNLVPTVIPPAGAPLKVRAASKKLATTALELQGITDLKMYAADSETDFKQLIRHIGELSIRLPSWRQQRASLLTESAEFCPGEDQMHGILLLRGFVRGLGLSVNQAVHLPGAGDFLLAEIRGPRRPEPTVVSSAKRRRGGAASMEVDTEGPAILATADEQQREGLQRENLPDPLDAEQTWPTEEEFEEAKMDIDAKKRRLPKGTSEYQAAWILDNDFSDEETEEVDLQSPRPPGGNTGLDEAIELQSWDQDMEDADAETSYGADVDASMSAEARKPSRKDQEGDLQFPDEIDTPEDIPARQRFTKYRGLKSWRSSPWDPKESLPRDYARIFAFQNMRRAEKRAKAAALRVGGPGDGSGVQAGSHVEVHVANIPQADALAIVGRVNAATQGGALPYTAFGLLQHETRLSVLNFAVKKAHEFADPLPNKASLLFVAGFRTFPAQPIFSTDEHGATKFKMERFLQPGQNAIATVYAPISYSPLPLLALSRDSESGVHKIAAAGSLRSCNPDRVVLKRIVLSGYPVRVHKKKAVVRWMFHHPDDVRWFRPLELWTKQGLRGRIKEPLGTHGAMKCIFDGTVKQSDAVCASLYKRIYPKWPSNLTFA